MNLNEFLRAEYKKDQNYPKTVVLTLKKYNYQITIKKIRHELNKIIAL